MAVDPIHSFEGWRERARELLAQEISPLEATWSASNQRVLAFARPGAASQSFVTVPKEFVALAKRLCLFRGEEALSLLYRILWRITQGERTLLGNPADSDVLTAQRFAKSVSRDVHKMHAFVRFRRVQDDHGERFIAFHRPDHYIVRAAVPFFVRRFGAMRWSIETPDETATWDTKLLTFTDGVPRPTVKDDPVEEEWRTYYRAIANPARLKLRAMKKEMPVRHWSTLPETSVMQALLAEAAPRVERMQHESVAAATPIGSTLEELRSAAECCSACPLYAHASQTVFGTGNPRAALVLVGEQPGDHEDRAGAPFIGPAGALLDTILAELAIDREQLYVTNAVKHFKFEERGKTRLHKKANGKEILACRPWLAAELERIRPRVILCMGVTAAQSVLGRTIHLGRERGQNFSSAFSERVLVTYHPSAVLRASESSVREVLLSALREDLRRAHALSLNGIQQRDEHIELQRFD